VNFVVNNRKFCKLYNLLFKGWFRTTGRSSRLEYTCRLLLIFFIALLPFITLFIIYNVLFFLHIARLNPILTSHIISILFLVLLPFLIIQILFASYRRLHDLNKSGWWLLTIITPLMPLLIIVLIFFKGTQEANQYGVPPTY
jgi:uncharacterized membrane protein YhaH (DUF805 family)